MSCLTQFIADNERGLPEVGGTVLSRVDLLALFVLLDRLGPAPAAPRQAPAGERYECAYCGREQTHAAVMSLFLPGVRLCEACHALEAGKAPRIRQPTVGHSTRGPPKGVEHEDEPAYVRPARWIAPNQHGLFATRRIRAGEIVAWYGGTDGHVNRIQPARIEAVRSDYILAYPAYDRGDDRGQAYEVGNVDADIDRIRDALMEPPPTPADYHIGHFANCVASADDAHLNVDLSVRWLDRHYRGCIIARYDIDAGSELLTYYGNAFGPMEFKSPPGYYPTYAEEEAESQPSFEREDDWIPRGRKQTAAACATCRVTRQTDEPIFDPDVGTYVMQAEALDEVAEMIARQIAERHRANADAPRVVAIVGAGLSTDAGIGGYSGFGAAPAPAAAPPGSATYQAVTVHGEPGPGHYALARLVKMGFVDVVVSQNVDGFEHAAMVQRGVEDRLIRPHVPKGAPPGVGVAFGAPLDPDVVARIEQVLASASLVLVLGASLNVDPVAGAVARTRDALKKVRDSVALVEPGKRARARSNPSSMPRGLSVAMLGPGTPLIWQVDLAGMARTLRHSDIAMLVRSTVTTFLQTLLQHALVVAQGAI